MPGGAPGKPGMPGGANGIGGRCREGGPIGGIMPIPRPAGIPLPGPTGSVDFLSSSPAGGGPSTLRLTTVSPRRITRPSVLFISCTGPASVSPGFFFGRTRLNSSHSARTRFMCLSKASIWPTNARPSLTVTLSLQLMRLSILPPFDLGGGMVGDGGFWRDGRLLDAANNELNARTCAPNRTKQSRHPFPKRVRVEQRQSLPKPSASTFPSLSGPCTLSELAAQVCALGMLLAALTNAGSTLISCLNTIGRNLHSGFRRTTRRNSR